MRKDKMRFTDNLCSLRRVPLILLAFVAFALIITGCSASKLADSFDAAAVEAKAKTVIETLNQSNYDGVVEMLREDLRDDLPADKLKAAVEQVYGDAGAFVAFEKVIVAGQKAENKDIAVTVTRAKYAEQTVTFTISFDQDLNVIGLYMK